MADDLINLTPPSSPAAPGGTGGAGPRPPARFETPGGDDEFDPANRSLASALRIAFVALQVVMAVLVAMYFFSGLQQVPEQSRGLRFLFGRMQDAEPLEAGGYFVWPPPIGDMLLVPSSQQEIALSEEFWPQLIEEQKRREFRTLTEMDKFSLVPGKDGSVITADHNLAHTQWTVQYQIVDARLNQETVPLTMVPSLVGSAVERAVVLGAAQTTLDDIMQSRDRLTTKVKQYAQEFLDRIDCGILITGASYQAYPPIPAQASYESVNQAHVQAAQAKVEAERAASERLNAVAGPAHQPLRTLIGEYEQLQALARTDAARAADAEAKRAEIDAILSGDAVGGAVASIIGKARSDRGELVASFRNDVERFNAWIDSFESNPTLTASLLWAETMSRVAKRNHEWFSIAPGTKVLIIDLNPDPERARRLQREKFSGQARSGLE